MSTLDFNSTIIFIFTLEESGAVCGWRRRLHLQREPRARIHRVRLAERVGDFLDIDRVKRDSDTDATTFTWVVDEDEFAFLGFWDVAKEGVALFFVQAAGSLLS